jgi:hypothetical protein
MTADAGLGGGVMGMRREAISTVAECEAPHIERRLMQEIMGLAFRDLRTPKGRREDLDALMAEAEDWFFGDQDSPFSFETACAVLGVKPSVMRSYAREYLASKAADIPPLKPPRFLTRRDANAMRKAHREHGLSARQCAERWGLKDVSHARKILRGERWPDEQGALETLTEDEVEQIMGMLPEGEIEQIVRNAR